MSDRVWTRWSDMRPPNERGTYRYRATAKILGVVMTPEWSEKMHLCGMGYSDSEWWPLSPCRWDGYRRYITNETLEWSAHQDGDSEDVVWNGIDLLPCPFTGAAPRLKASGRYIGAPLWESEAIYISSPAVPARRFVDAVKMIAAWNTRVPVAERSK